MSKILHVLGTLFSYAFYLAGATATSYFLADRKFPNIEQGIGLICGVTLIHGLVQLGLLKAKLEEIRKEIKLRKAPGEDDSQD